MEVANQFSNAQSFKFPRSDIDMMFLKCLLNLNYFGKIPKKDESSSFGCMIHTEFDCYAPCQFIITKLESFLKSIIFPARNRLIFSFVAHFYKKKFIKIFTKANFMIKIEENS